MRWNRTAKSGPISACSAGVQRVPRVSAVVYFLPRYSGVRSVAAKSQYVVPRGKKWAVRKSGSARVTRHFDTQQEALEAARRIARNQGSDVYIFGRDGRIRGRDSQVNGPHPSGG